MSNQNILSPVGRIVQGHAFIPNETDQQGHKLTIKSGANAGQPRVDYFISLAISKTDPEWNNLWAIMNQVANAAWIGGQSQAPGFSWKLKDGDGIDSKGQPFSNREGWAGCWIVTFSSSFAPKVYSANGATQLVEHNSVKRGDYARVYASSQGNNNTEKPGIYMNLHMIELIGYGAEIITGPDGATIFGAAPAALPAGASATPVAPSTPMASPGPVTQAGVPVGAPPPPTGVTVGAPPPPPIGVPVGAPPPIGSPAVSTTPPPHPNILDAGNVAAPAAVNPATGYPYGTINPQTNAPYYGVVNGVVV
jgi:hypothetical protein